MEQYSRLAGLPLTISGLHLEPLQLTVRSGWTRRTTVIRLVGEGEEGVGEDISWEPEDHVVFPSRAVNLRLVGSYTLEEFSGHLDDFDLLAVPSGSMGARLYRRWAFESAALDLALRQASRSLAGCLGIVPSPVSFVVSPALGEPARIDAVRERLGAYPGTRFKLDVSPSWSRELVSALAETRAVQVVDLKGRYRGSFTGPVPDAELYRRVAEGLPTVWIEDPDFTRETTPVLKPHRSRITWDAPIHSVADLAQLPFKPSMINIKPSRFGFLSEVLRTIEYCVRHGIRMYGGGQFELGPGRGQIQYLASLFYPEGPNDVAPVVYHRPEIIAGLPASPLPPETARIGFRWREFKG